MVVLRARAIWLSALLVAGCGRIDYDVLANASGSGASAGASTGDAGQGRGGVGGNAASSGGGPASGGAINASGGIGGANGGSNSAGGVTSGTGGPGGGANGGTSGNGGAGGASGGNGGASGGNGGASGGSGGVSGGSGGVSGGSGGVSGGSGGASGGSGGASGASSGGGGLGGGSSGGSGGGLVGAGGAATCTSAAYGGHDYAFCQDLRTWDAARADCLNRGMDLVRVNDTNENTWLNATAPFTPLAQNVMWLGGTDAVTEGEWFWTDQSQFWTGGLGGSVIPGAFAQWNTGEPNNNGEEDCLGMIISGGPNWNDQPCSLARPFICESAP